MFSMFFSTRGGGWMAGKNIWIGWHDLRLSAARLIYNLKIFEEVQIIVKNMIIWQLYVYNIIFTLNLYRERDFPGRAFISGEDVHTLLKLDFFPLLSPKQFLYRLRTCQTNIWEK